MKLTYETGVATLIQFIVLGLLNIANGLNSVVTTCHQDNSSCMINIFTSAVFFLLITTWFAFICFVGYMAQERRSKRLAQLLIACEGLTALIAYFNAKHHNEVLGLVTSLADLILALWVMTLAFRLMRSKGKRITRPRGRQRRHRPSP